MTHIFTPNPKLSPSKNHDVEAAVSPYEVSKNIDFDDPLEHSRDPKPRNLPPIYKNPARKSVEIKPKEWNPKGVHGMLRKVRYPELFHMSRYSLELINEMKREFPEPAAARVWIDEVLASGLPEDQRKKFVVTKHPAFPQYWALFELIRRPSMGPHYRLVSIAQHDNKEKGFLPAALMTEDHRWDHMRGEMGDPREFTKKDFEIIRTQADIAILGPKGVAMGMEIREAIAYNEKDRVENDFVADMHDYMFDWLRQAANYGRRHRSCATVVVGENSEKWYVEQRNGYKLKVPRGSKTHEELLESKPERIAFETEQAVKKFEAEKQRQALFRAGRTLGAVANPKKTL